MTVFRWAPQNKEIILKSQINGFMNRKLENKVAVVTGGNAGIGFRVPLL